MPRFTPRFPRLIFLSLTACAAPFLAGCNGSPEEAPLAAATPAVETIAVTYRVRGSTGAITGNYTGALGADVAIPASASQPWETTVAIPLTIMRGQPIKLSAQSATDPNATITIEMWADGKMIDSQTGTAPATSIQKH